MIKEAIEYLLKLKRPETIKVNGKDYSTIDINPIKEAECNAITVYNLNSIIKYLKNIIEEYDLQLRAIGYDPHNADGFLSDLEEFGVPLLEITQSARFLHDGTEDMQLNIESGKIKYNKSEELLSYSVSNAKVVRNSFDEKKIDKEPNAKTKRIDPVDAMIDAHITQMKFNEKKKIDYDKEMEEYLDTMGWSE